jgi:hypothetical protein
MEVQMDYDLYTELQQKRHDLSVCIRKLRETGSTLAEAERAYKVMLRAESLTLRDEGMPVTLIQLTVYGVESVAKLREERDKAEVIYKANQDAVNAIKLELRLIEAQLQREWATPQAGY